MNKKEEIEGLISLLTFVEENHKQGGLSKDVADQVEKLWNEYKEATLNTDCKVITAEFGTLGSIVIRDVSAVDENVAFKYESGSYDYISILTTEIADILWTDYKDIEPYNRQGGLYCDGSGFAHLGEPVVKKKDYREFYKVTKTKANITFGVWGFNYNSFYGQVRFGMCIKKDKVDKFVTEIRKIIGK